MVPPVAVIVPPVSLLPLAVVVPPVIVPPVALIVPPIAVVVLPVELLPLAVVTSEALVRIGLNWSFPTLQFKSKGLLGKLAFW